MATRIHPFKSTKLVPGWCTRCGEAYWTESHVPPHKSFECRPETCGGISYDPCPAGREGDRA